MHLSDRPGWFDMSFHRLLSYAVHSNHLRRGLFVSAGVVLFSSTTAFAQLLPQTEEAESTEVSSFVQDENLLERQEAALRALASGNPREALQIYDSILAKLGSKAEPLRAVAEDRSVMRKLNALKFATLAESGKGAALLNRSAAYLMIGQPEKALADLDQAAVLLGDRPEPWINGLLAGSALDRFAQVVSNAKELQRLGLESPRVLVARAEAALLDRKFDQCRDLLDQAERQSPDFPSALVLRAKLEQTLGRSRESERALAKALLAGPSVVGESRFQSTTGAGYGFGGGVGSVHSKLSHTAATQDGSIFRFNALTDRIRVENRAEAYQWRNFFEGVYAGDLGAVYWDYRENAGGRPGASQAIAGVNPEPTARFRLYTNLGMYAKNFELGRSELGLLVKYRNAEMLNRPNATAAWDNSLADRQINVEARWQWEDGSKRRWLVGGSSVQLNRSGSGVNSFDPGETVLGFGTTRLWSAYVAREFSIGKAGSGTIGALAGGLSTGTQVQPVVDLQFGTRKPIRFGIRPRFNNPGNDLLPNAFLAPLPVENGIDRHDRQPQDFNVDPLVQSRDTQLVDTTLSFQTIEGQRVRGKTTIFHRSLRSALLQGADPRAATALRLTPIQNGEAIGIEQDAEWNVATDLGARVKFAFQSTKGGPNTPVFSLDDFPTQVGVTQNRLPNFPLFQAAAEFDWSPGDTVLTASINYVGARPRAFSRTQTSGELVTYVGDAPGALGIHLFGRHKFSASTLLSFGLYNLTKARFYEGYPAATTGYLGFEYRY